MNLNTNTKKLTLTKTERSYLAKAKSVLDDVARLAKGDLADCADAASAEMHKVETLLVSGGVEAELPY